MENYPCLHFVKNRKERNYRCFKIMSIYFQSLKLNYLIIFFCVTMSLPRGGGHYSLSRQLRRVITFSFSLIFTYFLQYTPIVSNFEIHYWLVYAILTFSKKKGQFAFLLRINICSIWTLVSSIASEFLKCQTLIKSNYLKGIFLFQLNFSSWMVLFYPAPIFFTPITSRDSKNHLESIDIILIISLLLRNTTITTYQVQSMSWYLTSSLVTQRTIIKRGIGGTNQIRWKHIATGKQKHNYKHSLILFCREILALSLIKSSDDILS